jgi:hypothetical protein
MSYRLLYTIILIFVLVISMVSTPLTLSTKYANPSGLSTISSKTINVEIPPGTYYVVKVNPLTNKIVPEQISKPKLPSIAYEALEKVPSWIRPLLERQFYLLLQGDLEVPGNSTISLADVNNDSLVDIAVGASDGIVRIYLNVGTKYSPLFKLFTKINVTKDLGLTNTTLHYAAPALGDLDGDGLVDVVVGLENGSLVFYRNIGTETNPVWVLDTSYLDNVSVGGYAAPFIYDMNGDGVKDLVVGSEEGLIYCFINKGTPGSPHWVYVFQYFPAWIEDWWDGRGPHYEGVWVGNFSKPALFKLGNDLFLLIGNDKGEIYLFRATGYTGYPAWSNLGAFPEIKVSGFASPDAVDVNGDDLPDLVIGSSDGKVYVAENFGSPMYPGFTAWPSQAEKYLLANWFWGPAYYPLLDTLETVDIDTKYVEHYASLILNTTDPYIDEVAYAIAVDRPSNLKMLADRNGSYLYVLNAKSIYDIAKNLSYVEISEHDGYTTLKYKTEDGWKELPKDIYYKYLVTFSRYIIAPWAWPSRYNGKFFRTFLPYDKRYGVSLLERVHNASTMYEAAYLVDYWLRVDIGAYWHRGTKYWKPPGWYNIYLHLNDTEWTIFCGEFAIIYEVSARAVLIPTVNIVDIAEDHQFNNFWYNGKWHHVDASSGSPGINGTWSEYFDPPRGLAGWYKNIGFSYPIEWEENGMYDPPWRSPIPYAPEGMIANLTFKVTDINGRPIDGARVEVWSHWTIESGYDTAPYIAGFVFTDMNGIAHFNLLGLGRTKNFTVIVTSRIGSTMLEIHLEHGGNYSFDVVIPNKLPNIQLPIGTINIPHSNKYVSVKLDINGGEQNPPSWIHILYVLFNYKYYVELGKNNVWADVFILNNEEYEKFSENAPFQPFIYSLGVNSADLENIPVNDTIYIVVSNRRSTTTWINISLTITLSIDNSAPDVTILKPTNNAILNSSTVVVKVESSSSDVAYYEISIDGSEYEKITNNVFILENLSDGRHIVSVRAVDISGNIGEEKTVVFTIDTTPPIITIDHPSDGELVLSSNITVTGRIIGGVKAWLNNEELSLGKDGSFTKNIILNTGLNTITLKAVDEAGNLAVKTIRVYYYLDLATTSDLRNVANNITSTINNTVNNASKTLEDNIEEGINKGVNVILRSLTNSIASSSSELNKSLTSRLNSLRDELLGKMNNIDDKVSTLNDKLNSLGTDLSVLGSSIAKNNTVLSGKVGRIDENTKSLQGYMYVNTGLNIVIILLAIAILLLRKK